MAVFTDIEEVPEDEGIPEDEGDGGEGVTADPELEADALTVPRRPRPTHVVVLWHRQIKRGTTGRDVVAVKRALSVAGYLKWPKNWTIVFGPIASNALKKFQKRHGLKADGVYGPLTHKKLAPYYDRYGAFLLAQVPRAKNSKRGKVVANALWGYHHRGQIHYRQWRPIRGLAPPRRLPLYTDCSGFSTDVYKWAGAPDPNGFNYNGQGFTGSLVRRGTWTKSPKPGDLVLYGGPAPYKHVAIYVGGGKVVSHGSEGGPYFLNMHYRGDVAGVRSYL